MNHSALSPADVDVRAVSRRQKDATVFAHWADTPVGDHFVFVDDHDPVDLYYRFAAGFPGTFTWEYVTPGPDEYRVRLTRVAPSPSDGVETSSHASGASRGF